MDQIKWQINHHLFPQLKPQDLNLLVSEFMRGGGKTIKDIPRRTVKKIKFNGKEVFFVKHIKIIGLDTRLKYFFFPWKIFTEWRIMNQVVALGIPTAFPVALGINRKIGFLKEAFIVTQSLEEMITIQQFYRQNIKTEFEKDEFLQNLASFFRSLHQKGVLHHDIHLDNIVVPTNKSHPYSFYLIDLYKARIKRNPSKKKKLLNLVRFLSIAYELKVFSRRELEKFIRIYYHRDFLSEKIPGLIMEKIFQMSKKLSEGRFRSWGGKSFRPGKFFSIQKGKGKFLIHRREFDP